MTVDREKQVLKSYFSMNFNNYHIYLLLFSYPPLSLYFLLSFSSHLPAVAVVPLTQIMAGAEWLPRDRMLQIRFQHYSCLRINGIGKIPPASFKNIDNVSYILREGSERAGSWSWTQTSSAV